MEMKKKPTDSRNLAKVESDSPWEMKRKNWQYLYVKDFLILRRVLKTCNLDSWDGHASQLMQTSEKCKQVMLRLDFQNHYHVDKCKEL